MAPDLGLVADAAQGNPNQLPAQGSRNAPPQGGLAHPGWTDKAENRRLQRSGLGTNLLGLHFGIRLGGGVRDHWRRGLRLGRSQGAAFHHPLAHRHPLEDSLLDLGQSVVVLIEDSGGLADVHPLQPGVLPRQVDQPLHVGAHDADLGGGAGQRLQPIQLLERPGVDCLGHTGGVDALAKVILGSGFTANLGQFLADGLELFAQDRLALPLVDGLSHVLLDLVAQLRHLELARQQRHQAAQPSLHIRLLEQRDAIQRVQIRRGAGQIGHLARLLGAGHRDRQLRRHRGPGGDVIGEHLAHRAGQGVDLSSHRLGIGQLDKPRRPDVARLELDQSDASQPLDQHLGAGRSPPERSDLGHSGDRVEVEQLDLVQLALALHRKHDLALGGHGGFQAAHRPIPACS